MSEQTVTVETTQIEKEDVRFCDCCSDPVGDEYKDHVELAKNPSINVDARCIRSEVESSLLSAAKTVKRETKAQMAELEQMSEFEREKLMEEQAMMAPGGEEIMSVGHRGIRRRNTPVWLEELREEVDQLMQLAWSEPELDVDASLDVCHECLEFKLGGPERSALETLDLDKYKQDEAHYDDETGGADASGTVLQFSLSRHRMKWVNRVAAVSYCVLAIAFAYTGELTMGFVATFAIFSLGHIILEKLL